MVACVSLHQFSLRKAVAKLVKVDDRDIFVAACEVRVLCARGDDLPSVDSHSAFEGKVIESQRVEVLSDH